MPKNSNKARQLTKYKLPTSTSVKGLRVMQQKDVPAVQDLLRRYLARFDMAPNFDAEEVQHWMVHNEKSTAEQVIWTYVVEDPSNHKITDFFSFYCLESSVIKNPKHDNVRAAYMFYYASEAAFAENEKGLKERLNDLMSDALVLAKGVSYMSLFMGVVEPNGRTVQLRCLQRLDLIGQSVIPRTAEVRTRRRSIALLHLQLPHASYCRRG